MNRDWLAAIAVLTTGADHEHHRAVTAGATMETRGTSKALRPLAFDFNNILFATMEGRDARGALFGIG